MKLTNLASALSIACLSVLAPAGDAGASQRPKAVCEITGTDADGKDFKITTLMDRWRTAANQCLESFADSWGVEPFYGQAHVTCMDGTKPQIVGTSDPKLLVATDRQPECKP